LYEGTEGGQLGQWHAGLGREGIGAPVVVVAQPGRVAAGAEAAEVGAPRRAGVGAAEAAMVGRQVLLVLRRQWCQWRLPGHGGHPLGEPAVAVERRVLHLWWQRLLWEGWGVFVVVAAAAVGVAA